ncbi:Uncharacterised protein [Legionella hackeliae]|nr:hypothetical protein Lhac_1650 [Legionella hackeliae]STX48988.1 Uncharacterised protein [Legionella hackeliae]
MKDVDNFVNFMGKYSEQIVSYSHLYLLYARLFTSAIVRLAFRNSVILLPY